VSVLIWQQVFC